MSVIIDLKVTHSVSILGTNAPVFSAAFDSIVSGRCCILVKDCKIHLEDRIIFEFGRISLHFDPELRFCRPGSDIKSIAWHIIGALSSWDHLIANAISLFFFGTLLVNGSVHIALGEVIGPSISAAKCREHDCPNY